MTERELLQRYARGERELKGMGMSDRAKLAGTNLTDAYLIQAVLMGTDLQEADWQGVHWKSAILPDGTICKEGNLPFWWSWSGISREAVPVRFNLRSAK